MLHAAACVCFTLKLCVQRPASYTLSGSSSQPAMHSFTADAEITTPFVRFPEPLKPLRYLKSRLFEPQD